MTKTSAKLPVKHDERAYASFMRQLAHQDDRPAPKPLPPAPGTHRHFKRRSGPR